MQRRLPAEPHLDHLKKQAKELLDGHQRGDREALGRIRAALPSFGSQSEDEVARASFALHDAQSAIAREYGFKSWKELSDEVARRRAPTLPEATMHALVGARFQELAGVPLPQAMLSAMQGAWSADDTADALSGPVPDALPLIAARNVLLVPGVVAPLHIGRPSSLAALDAAQKETTPMLAVFAQRDDADEDVRFESLHRVGCQVLLLRREPHEGGRAFIVVRALRWIALTSLDPAGPTAGSAHAVAHVAPVAVDAQAESEQIPALVPLLRERARNLARLLPEGEAVVARIDALDDAEHLANLLVANLPCSVEDKVRYAEVPTLAAKLRIANALADAAFAARKSA